MFFRTRRKPLANAYVISDSEPGRELGRAPAEPVRVAAKTLQRRTAVRARARIFMCAVVFVFMFAGLAVRLAYVSFGGAVETKIAAAPSAVDARRPELTDRKGALLATDLPMVALEVAGREVWDGDETAAALKTVLPEIDETVLAEKLNAGRYVEVANDLSPAQRAAVFALGEPGVRFSIHNQRFYPQADLAAHVVGHGAPGRGGVMGLERFVNGMPADTPVRASIDVRVQQALENELSETMEKFSAKAAWGGVIDVTTGEVVALASLPDFDPNKPGASPDDARRNRATYDRYELGSAFKTLLAASALEDRIAEEFTPYDARGSFKVADWTIRDFHGENRILTFSEVIQYSSNIGAARIVGDLGVKRQKHYLRELGLFDALDIELAENRPTELPPQWGPVESATISYGHGISVTPLHLLAAFAAVVNGGDYFTPTFIAGDDAEKGDTVFSEHTSAVMRRILRRVIIDGTASKAEAEGYFPIGKTATADKPAFGGYRKNARIASFVGAVPGYAPRYAILISFDEPQPLEETFGYATAGWNAAPAFARFVERAAPLLGLAPVNEATALAAFASDGPFQEARLSLEEGRAP